MAFPFYPMTDEILKKLSRVIRDSVLAAKFSEPGFVLAPPKAKIMTDANPPSSKENPNYLHT
jgi:hypothetical protein